MIFCSAIEVAKLLVGEGNYFWRTSDQSASMRHHSLSPPTSIKSQFLIFCFPNVIVSCISVLFKLLASTLAQVPIQLTSEPPFLPSALHNYVSHRARQSDYFLQCSYSDSSDFYLDVRFHAAVSEPSVLFKKCHVLI